MVKNSTAPGTDQKPNYARAKGVGAHFKISRSTVWEWRTRPGFPQPLRAGPKTVLFDINAIDAYLKAQAGQ